jgi:hypothetical protein
MAERAFTDLELERLLADDLPAARVAEIEAKSTAADRARLAELRAEQAAFLGSVDVAAEVRGIGKKLGAITVRTPPPRRVWWRWVLSGGALAAAVAALLLFIRREKPVDEPDLQIKGNAISLVIHTPTRQLATGDKVLAGERIRFELVAPTKGYVVIVGVDGSGKSTVYHPYGGSEAAPFDPAAAILPGAIQLDATPGDEMFYAYYSEEPFAVQSVLPAAPDTRIPYRVNVAHVVLRKQL